MFTKQISSVATNNAQRIRANGNKLISINAFNAGAAVAYVKIYNQSTIPAPATDVPFYVLAVPATGNARVDFGDEKTAMQMPAGLGLAIVTGAADTDNIAVAAAQLKVVITYGG